MTMHHNLQNYRLLLKAVPGLQSIVETLNTNHIRYGIYSGSYVYITTANRTPADVDILVADEDIPKIKKLFSACECIDREYCLCLYPLKDKRVEIVSRSVVHIGGVEYSFKLTDLAWQHTHEIGTGHYRVRLCDSVDTILLKAILQRGEAEGKFDLSDIEALLGESGVDEAYLEKRAKEFGLHERLRLILQKYHLPFKLA